VTLGEAAVNYAGRGMAVFPLRPKTKEPHGALAPHGHLDATTDVERVRAWWGRCPNANIGMPCAPKLLVLDEDPRHGGDQALESLFMQAPRYGFETLTSLTGGGGRHFLFQHPLFDVPVDNIAAGLDIKSKGYITLPPSIHPSGRPYAWEDPSAPITEVPDWLLQIIAQKIQRRESSPKAASDTGTITEGQRNDTLFRIACSLRGKGLSEAAIRAALIEENRARCSPALPDDEVRRIAASASKYEPGADTAPEPQRGLSAVGIDVSAVRTPAEALAVLNTLTLWKGRIRWQAFRRRGSQIEGQTEDGAAVRFAADRILTFAYARAQVYAATDVAILEPKRGKINATWAEACELISHAARADAVQCGNPEDDLAADLRRVFELSGKPRPRDSDELFRLLVNLKTYRREPHADKAPPCVFVWKARTWCHLPVLRLWLGTPAGLARHATLPVLGEQLALLGFQRAQDLEVERGDKRVRVDAWSGPADFVEAAEAGETGE
jgi:hypothetical protein